MTKCKIYAYCFCQALQAKTSHFNFFLIAETLLTIVTFHLTVVFFGYEYVYRVFFSEGQCGALLRLLLFFNYFIYFAITSWTSKSLSLSLS